ncbi:5-oxoprolinase subunit B family protein [Methylocapsa acidiphila]|uniref:5-oxoprolinase subunit B family protein n=1 Tax=Methylocapsa acidiphila TaxID=133552 RepID=UPI00042681A1|nr:allophanate hydrolase subunit 1 [Methylocapsa acidiphila]
MTPPAPRYLPAGESALVVEFGQTIEPAIHDAVMALDAALAQAKLEGVRETVPTYRSLVIHFDPRRITTAALIEAVRRVEMEAPTRKPPTRWRIPACYDAPHAEDVGEIAAILGLPETRIVELHLSAVYRVYMYGFAPGYTFLGGLPEALTIPRRATPRAPAPPGSLLIAGGQALIASVAMPTGWYGVGRTPVRVFDPHRERVFLADIGDEITFERVDRSTFDALSRAAESGELVARRHAVGE